MLEPDPDTALNSESLIFLSVHYVVVTYVLLCCRVTCIDLKCGCTCE